MEFKQAYEALKQGATIKRRHWEGHWERVGDKIVMHCKDGKHILLTDTEDIFFTLDNICADDWRILNEKPALNLVNTFTFGEAIRKLKQGKRVARKGWNGKGIFIELQVPDAHSKMTHPYVYIDTTGLQTTNPDAPKDRVPWLASQTDMLAEDWTEVS